MVRIHTFLSKIAHFGSDKAASIAVIMALSAAPILIAVSLAIDFSRAADQKAKLDAAIDATVLYAATLAAKSPTADVEDLKTQAKKFFDATLANTDTGLNVAPIEIKIERDKIKSNSFNVNGSYTATIDTLLGNLYKPIVSISGGASSSMDVPLYIDFYLMLDNSPSMGLAATDDDIQRLRTLTKFGPGGEQADCQFACHIVVTNPKNSKQTAFRDGVNNSWEKDNSSPTGLKQDYYTIAKAAKPPIQLRIDMLAQAVQALATTAENTETHSGLANQFRMAIYTFNDAVQYIASPGATKSEPLSSNLSAVGTTAASSVTIYSYKDNDVQDKTNFQVAFQALDNLNLQPGDGSTAAKPQKYVFLVTDGVADATTARHQGPIDPTLCNNLKNKGVKIAVLYTPYLRLTNNGYYMANIDPFISQVPLKLQACATSGLFYTADSAGIAAAMKQMFQDTIRAARLTK